jgi:hypothetical protein
MIALRCAARPCSLRLCTDARGDLLTFSYALRLLGPFISSIHVPFLTRLGGLSFHHKSMHDVFTHHSHFDHQETE